jgi:hypothetical protein
MDPRRRDMAALPGTEWEGAGRMCADAEYGSTRLLQSLLVPASVV